MSGSLPRNLAGSISHRLLSLSRERGEEYQQVLMRYAGERLLYRLSLSVYRDRFVLKGARLFELWASDMLRPPCKLTFRR
jgi:hypothetical protein